MDDLTPEPIDQSELTRIKGLIDDELRALRPDRYEPGDEFLDEVVERVAPHIPATMARAMLAKDLVGQREGQATRRGNKFLKTIIGKDGQHALPIDWHFYVAEPVALMVPVVDSATSEPTGDFRRERVALRAMTSADWRHFTNQGRVEAQHRFDAEMAMYEAADWLAEQQAGGTFAEWAEQERPSDDEVVAS